MATKKKASGNGKAKTKAKAKAKTPTKGTRVKVKTAAPKKNGKNGKAKAARPRRGRPPENKDEPWRTVLRLPPALATKLKKAAAKNEVSINSAIETVVSVWVKSEGV